MLRHTFQPNRKIDILSQLGFYTFNFNNNYNLIKIKLSDQKYHKWGYTTLKLTLRCTDNYNTGIYDYFTEYKLHMTDNVKFSKISISYTDLVPYDQPYFVSPIFLVDGYPYIAIWKNYVGNISPIVDLSLEYLGSSEYQTIQHGLFNNLSVEFYNIPNLLKYTRTQGKYDLYDIYNSIEQIVEFKDIFKNLSLNILNDNNTHWISLFNNLELYNKQYSSFKIPKNKYDYIKIKNRRSRGGYQTGVGTGPDLTIYNGGLNEFINILKTNQCFLLALPVYEYTNKIDYYKFQSSTPTIEYVDKIVLMSESSLVYINEDDLYWYIRLSDLFGNATSNNVPDNMIEIDVRDVSSNPFSNIDLSDLEMELIAVLPEKKLRVNNLGSLIRWYQSRATTSFINDS